MKNINKLLKQLYPTPKSKSIINQNNSLRTDLKDEVKKLHLVDRFGKWRALIILRCTNCKEIHPSSPAALVWWKSQKDKDQLKCPSCGGKNFVRTRSQTTQGELMSEAIDEKTSVLKREIEDQVGTAKEGKHYERKYGVKII